MSEFQSDTIGKIATALVKAQATMGVAVKDSTNPHFKSKYADLGSVASAARDALAANDLAVIQRAFPNDRGVQLQTMIVHSSGEWIADGGLTLPATKLDPQQFGSAMTYARRYGLAAMLGIVQDDDDGAAAVAAQHKAREAAQAAALAPKLTAAQQACLDVIGQACGYASKDRSDLLADDYARHVDGALAHAVKQRAIPEGDVDAARKLALKGDADKLRSGLGLEVAA